MVLSKLTQLYPVRNLLSDILIQQKSLQIISRTGTHYRSGALKGKPPIMPFGFVGVFSIVVPGVLIGAMISKNMANFLEENELFVVSDDDDEDDD